MTATTYGGDTATWGSFTWGETPPGYYLELSQGTDTLRLTELQSVQTTREHTALSSWSVSVPYNESLEQWELAEVDLWFGGEYLFRGYLFKIESDEGTAETRLSGKGVGHDLTRSDAVVTYGDPSQEYADDAIQNYLDNHSAIGGTVTAPTYETVDDESVETATTTPEFDALLNAAIPATTPLESAGGEIHTLRTGYLVEAEDADTVNGSTVTPSGASGSQAVTVDDTAQDLSHTFTLEYTIPSGHAKVGWRRQSPGGEPDYVVEIDGEVVDQGLAGGGPSSWQWEQTQAASSDLSGDVTVSIKAEEPGDTDDAGDMDVDLFVLYDDRFSYNFDNSVDANDALAGPQEYPNATADTEVEFADAGSVYNITAVSLSTTWNDATGNQIAYSVDGGSTWSTFSGTDTVNDDAVSVATSKVRARYRLGRTDSGSTTTPTTGDQKQAIEAHEILVDGNTRGVVDDETLDGTDLENLQKLCKLAGLRMVVNHDPDSKSIEVFKRGDVVGSASWDAENYKRTRDVSEYANKVTIRGAQDSNGDRLEATAEDADEIADVGEWAITDTDVSLDTQAAVDSRARVERDIRVANRELKGSIEVWPTQVEPGKAYPVAQWGGSNFDLERVRYSYGVGGQARGTLSFEPPEDLAGKLAEQEQATNEVADAL